MTFILVLRVKASYGDIDKIKGVKKSIERN